MIQKHLKIKVGYKYAGRILFAVVLAFLYLTASVGSLKTVNVANAAVPKVINFQGKLTAVSNGNNVANGSYSFEFKLYTASSGGVAVWTETFDQAAGACSKLVVTNGVFNAKLGSCSSLAAVDFTGGSMYLTVNFAPTGVAYDGEMSPRKQLLTSAYALVANGVSGDGVINTTVQSTTALTVGLSGANPALQVDTNTASSATGLKVTSAAAGGGVALAVISSGANENLTLNAKGSGTISIGNVSTGNVLFGSAGQLSITSAGTVSTSGNISTTGSGTITSAGLLTSTGGLTSSGTITFSGLGGGGTQCVTANNTGVLGVGSCGSALTPWTSDIDADGFDLRDLSNLEFRDTTGAPAGSVVAIFSDNTGDININSLTGKTTNIQVNGVDEYNFSSTGLGFNSNNITGLGTALTATAGLTVSSTSADLNLSTTTSGNVNLNSAGGTIELQDNTNVTGNLDVSGTIFAGTGDAFQVATSGAVTAVGVNSGTGLIQGTGGMTVTGTTQINATGSGTTTLGNASAGAMSIQGTTVAIVSNGATNDITLTSADQIILNSTGTIELQDPTNITGNTGIAGNLDVSGTLAVGTADAMTVSATGTVTIATGQSYTGAGTVSLTSAAASSLTINSGTTGTLAIGDDAFAETINLGTGAAAKTLTIGSTNTTSTTVVQSGSGNIQLQANGTGTGTVYVGNTSATTTPDLLVVGSKSDAGNPTGINGAIYYNNTGKFMVFEGGSWKELCNKTDAACGAGSGSSLSAISAATATNSIDNAEFAQVWGWNTAATAAALDSFTLSVTNDATTDATTQRLLVLSNVNSTGTSNTERLLVLNNLDTDEAVTTALEIASTGGGAVTTAIDVSDSDIGTAIAAGANDLSGTAWNITGATGAAVFVGVNSGTGLIQGTGGLTVTGTTQINASGTGTTTIGNASAGALSMQGSTVAITSNGATNDITLTSADQIILNSTGTIELQDSTNVTGTLTASTGLTATTGNVAITAGALTLNGITRISNAGVGTFITGTTIGSQTFTTNNISDSGALTINATNAALTLQTTTAGNIVLNSAGGTIELQDNTNITGNLDVSGTLTAGTANAFTVSAAGAIVGVGVNSGTGQIQGTGGLAVSGTTTINTTGTANTTIGNTAGGTITIGAASGSDLALQDAQWSVTGAGVASLASLTLGTALSDANVADTLTVDSASSVHWNALNNYPAACAAGSAISQLADTTNTCTSFNTDTSITLQDSYNATSGNTITTTDARNIAFTLAEVTTPTSFTITNQDTAGTSAQYINNTIATGTLTNGLYIENTGAGTLTNAIQIDETAGTITDGILIVGTLGNILNSDSIDITGAGAITGATGITSTTGNITATAGGFLTGATTRISNAGVGTFITGTTIGSQTFTTNNISDSGALTINATNAALTLQTTTAGNIVLNSAGGTIELQDNTNITGNLDASGTLQAGSSNVTLTLATGFIDADAITLITSGGTGAAFSVSGLQTVSDGLGLLQGCADGQILKWDDATDVRWECAADNSGAGTFSGEVDTTTNGALTFTTDDASPPAGTVNSIFRDNTGDMNINTVTGKTLNVQIAGTDEYNFSSTALALNSNNITGVGTNITATGALTVASTSGALTLQTNTSGNVILNSTGGTIELQDSTNVTGALDVSTTLAVGTANAFTVSASGEVVSSTVSPSANDTYDLGSSSFRWFGGYFSDSTGVNIAGTGYFSNSISSTVSTYTLNMSNAANSTFVVNNSGAGVASIQIEAGGSYTGAGAVTLSSGGTNTALTLNANGTGNINIGSAGTGSILFAGGTGSTGCTITTAGVLTCDGTITGSGLSGTNSGDVTLTAIGSTPNANGATLTGQALNLQPANGSFGGVVSTTTQTFAGAKTFTSALSVVTAVPNALTTLLTLDPNGGGTGIQFDVIHGTGTNDSAFQLKAMTGGTYTPRLTMDRFSNFGFMTTAPDRGIEINNASGNNLRLTYNDSDGSAANYADFLMSATGDLTITPSGGDTTVTGTLAVSGLAINSAVYTNGSSVLTTTAPTSGALGYWSRTGTTLTPTTTGDVVTIQGPTPSGTTAVLQLNSGGTANNNAMFTVSSVDTATGGRAGTRVTLSGDNGGNAGSLQIDLWNSTSGNRVLMQGSNGITFDTTSASTGGSGSAYLFRSVDLAGFGGLNAVLAVQDASSNDIFHVKQNGFVGIGASASSKLTISGNVSATAWGVNGINLQTAAATFTDSSTAASGTATNSVFNSFGIPTLAATNTTVTTTNAATLYVAGAPTAGTNQTITNAYALWVDAGSARIDDNLVVGTNIGTGTYITPGQVSFNSATQYLNTTDLVLFYGGYRYNGAGNGMILEASSILQLRTNSNIHMTLNSSGLFGFGTTGPDKKVEINSATGDNLRLTYNDADGTAANYADFLMSATGDLTITPSGGDTTITGNLLVSSLASAGTQCVQASSTGVLSVTGAACGAGGGTAWNAITVPTGNLTLAMDADTTTFNYDTLTTTNAFTYGSTSITSGSLLNFNHSTSAFTGNAINMNMANASGTFTGNFADFKVNGTSKIVINSGTETVSTGVAGIFEDLTLTNGTASGFIFGNRLLNTVNGGTAGTNVGQFIRMTDNTSLASGQVVRGLEVQAYSGSNNNGINTGIQSYGKTFGISAETSAQAGAVSQPAAVFAYLNQAAGQEAVGNAIRAYSNTATSAELVSIYQETSTYTGSALEINVNGTFTTGNFADFQKAGTTKFKVAHSGIVTLNLNGTVSLNGLCHDGADVDAATDTERAVVACSAAPGDIAEWYETKAGVTAGDVVSITDQTFTYQEPDFDPATGLQTGNISTHTISVLDKSTSAYDKKAFGVVSYSPYQAFGEAVKDGGAQNPQPIALNGRVPVKVTAENGNIKAGDYLTTSATVAGKAMKSTRPGMVIGQALSDYNGTGIAEVIVFISPFYYDPSVVVDASGNVNLQMGTAGTKLTAQTETTAAYTIDQQGSGAILQLQQDGMDRLLVGNNGSLSLNTSPVDDAELILDVKSSDTSKFSINARGDVAVSGVIVIKDDTFAGSIATGVDGLAEITFSYHLGTGKPVIQLTAEAQIPVFAQIMEFKTDADGNYTGFVMKTFDLISGPISAVVHYNVTGKQDEYTTFGEIMAVEESPYAGGNGEGLIIEGGEVVGGSGDGSSDGGVAGETTGTDTGTGTDSGAGTSTDPGTGTDTGTGETVSDTGSGETIP